jgi:hypothetical protein
VRVGSFTLREAVTLEALKSGHSLQLRKPDAILAALPAVAVHSTQLVTLQQGKSVILAEGFPPERLAKPTCGRRFLVRICGETGALAGIGEVVNGGSLRPVRMMPHSGKTNERKNE